MNMVLLLLLSTGAQAATINVTGDTTGSPTWGRPGSGTPPTSGSTSSPFNSYSFTVDVSGAYDVEIVTQTFDSYLHLFENSFNPLTPFANIIEGDDDDGLACGLCAGIYGASMTAGTTYFAIISGFGGASGSYDMQLSGAGNITPATASAVPVPAAVWLMGSAILGLLGAGRRKTA